jgi:hypothetical protein
MTGLLENLAKACVQYNDQEGWISTTVPIEPTDVAKDKVRQLNKGGMDMVFHKPNGTKVTWELTWRFIQEANMLQVVAARPDTNWEELWSEVRDGLRQCFDKLEKKGLDMVAQNPAEWSYIFGIEVDAEGIPDSFIRWLNDKHGTFTHLGSGLAYSVKWQMNECRFNGLLASVKWAPDVDLD